MRSPSQRRHPDSGAVLVHVAIALIGLLLFSVFAVDYGVMWASRRQAQNAADAAALAGAVSLAYVSPSDQGRARQAASSTGRANAVWGQQPVIDPNNDVFIESCPPGSPGLPDTCVRANVYRNQAAGNPLPTFFARLAGVNQQGVRATATAQVAIGASARCLKPWAIPDRWQELRPTPADWDRDSVYEHWDWDSKTKTFQELTPHDSYIPPGVTGHAGFDPFDATQVGTQVTLKMASPSQAKMHANAGWYYPIDLPMQDEPDAGGDRYRTNIQTCVADPVSVGQSIWIEPGMMTGPTWQGLMENKGKDGLLGLIAQDPGAYWDADCNCVQGSAYGVSPRVVPIPVFSPEAYDTLPKDSGRYQLQIVKIVGFFLEDVGGKKSDLTGRLMVYPADAGSGLGTQDPSSFLRTVILVR